MTHYEIHKRWRYKHPDKRNAAKKRNYSQTLNATNRKTPLSLSEIDMILKHEMSDRELSKRIGRSVQSIQVARCRYKKKEDKI